MDDRITGKIASFELRAARPCCTNRSHIPISVCRGLNTPGQSGHKEDNDSLHCVDHFDSTAPHGLARRRQKAQ